MSEQVIQATVMMAKCRRGRQSFGIRTEQRSNKTWYCTWAFKMSESAAANEGYSNVAVKGNIDFTPDYPGCPYCGASGWFTCGKCGKLTCNDGEDYVTCSWCGNSGGSTEADTFDLKGGGY